MGFGFRICRQTVAQIAGALECESDVRSAAIVETELSGPGPTVSVMSAFAGGPCLG
nr:hypothetical protein JVH1_4765 [Rhodococcus sp. JVH1]